jgi:hypothetical protein
MPAIPQSSAQPDAAGTPLYFKMRAEVPVLPVATTFQVDNEHSKKADQINRTQANRRLIDLLRF